jgi:hypothetical protein
MKTAIEIPSKPLADLCRRWGIVKLEMFGSALRDDFDPARSDVDLLVTFAPGRLPGWEFFAELPAEFARLFGRKVDLLTRRAVEESHNWIRRRAILESAVPVYEAKE